MNKNNSLNENFFTLLNNNNDLIESYDNETLSKIDDNLVNKGIDYLEQISRQVVSKDNSVNELTENTSLYYRYIYSIFMALLIILILGIVTYLKSAFNISENTYLLIIIFIILTYIFYVMYLFNIMYVKDSINKILHFFRTGRFEIGTVKLGNMPKSVYMQQLCKKRQELEDVLDEEDFEKIDPKSLSKTDYLANITNTNNAYVYNDNTAPNLQLYPRPTSNKFMIYNADSNLNESPYTNTNRL